MNPSAYDGRVDDPTGSQVHLQRGRVRAQIAQVGASLRALTVADTVVVPPYPADLPTPGCAGVVLAPWPNRIRDGLWDDEGIPRQLALTEPARGNASHGLLRFTAYEIEATDAEATLRARIHPQTGYPYLIDTAVTYALTETGIDVTHRLVNRSMASAPVAVGTHPYVTIGGANPRDLVLRVPARILFETDERMLPTGTAPAPEALRTGVRLGEASFDTGFGKLEPDADGRVRCTLTAPDSRSVSVWQGEGFDFVQIFTTTAFPGQELAVAIEPMTAPADAFNSGIGIRRLEPGEAWELRWGIEYAG